MHSSLRLPLILTVAGVLLCVLPVIALLAEVGSGMVHPYLTLLAATSPVALFAAAIVTELRNVRFFSDWERAGLAGVVCLQLLLLSIPVFFAVLGVHH